MESVAPISSSPLPSCSLCPVTEGLGKNILNFKSIAFEFTLSVTEVGMGKNILNFMSITFEFILSMTEGG